MTLERRMRLALAWQMGIAVAILAALSVLIAGTAIVVSGLLTWLLLFVGVVVLESFVFVVPGGPSGWITGTIAHRRTIVLVSGLILLPVVYLRPVRDDIRAFRTELGATGSPAAQTHPELAETTRRLATQVGVPAPTVYVANRQQPESYAVGGRSSGTIIVTTGLIRSLSDEELEAVLAHEVSHLVNGDSRIMNLALVPLLTAEHVGENKPPSKRLLISQPLAYPIYWLAWAGLTAVTRLQRWGSQSAIGTLSQSREFAADRGAAKITGAPSALASALRTLEDVRETPREDKRTWAKSASALDILPREKPAESGGGAGAETGAEAEPRFRTHPPTERRIEHLESLAVDLETDTGGHRHATK